MRCLSLNQVYDFFYANSFLSLSEFHKNIITPMYDAGLIDYKKSDSGIPTLVLKQKGIDLLSKQLKIPKEIYDADTGKVKPGILSASKINIDEAYMNHQLALNQFVLEFSKIMKTYHNQEIAKKVRYFDEAYLSQYGIIRPDGLIRIGGLDLFLEQDMGTESNAQLQTKWNRYRRFLNIEFKNNPKRKIVVLFIIDCKDSMLESRKNLIRKTIVNTFDTLLTNQFEIYIGNKKEMLETVFNRVLPGDKARTKQFLLTMKKHGYKVNDGSKLKMKLDGSVYHYYISKGNNGKLGIYAPNPKRQGRFLEFLGDLYDYHPMSILSKIAFHNRNSHNFDLAYSPKKANQRLIGYIVVVDDVHKLYSHLKSVNLLNTHNVYFTTYKRLKYLKLPRALFNLNEKGELFSCSDEYFEPRILEDNVMNMPSDGLKTEFLKKNNK